MKYAIVGKGGSGKTTVAAVVARTLARRGLRVVALDCDTNPNLGISLGIGEEETERLVAMRQALDEGNEEHAREWDTLLERFGSDGPDGVRLAVVSRIENPNPGCPCCGLSPEQLLATLGSGSGVVVADLEAGIGTLTRLSQGGVNVVVIVVEPTPRSLEVGRRAAELATERDVGRVIVIANRVQVDEDLLDVRRFFPGLEVVGVPYDIAIVDADRLGLAPLDTAPDSSAIRALEDFTDQLQGWVA